MRDQRLLPELCILGTRGVPAKHGGFETFAEHFATYLAKEGHRVRVYCQEKGKGGPWQDVWNGVERVHIPVTGDGPFSTMIFDWKATRHACKQKLPQLTLGYNTAIFAVLTRLSGCRNTMNMDGIEWQRQKWSPPIRLWFYLNELLGSWLADHLIADHPEIARHLQRRVSSSKITVIPYGADTVSEANEDLLQGLGVTRNSYLLVVARPEPENSIREIIRAFSSKRRNVKLLVLGDFRTDRNKFHRQVMSDASEEVLFPGAIYDKDIVRSLRANALLYIHGHQVGGTNPSLVEALGCGSAVLAHNNRFNRWVAGEGACYFNNEEQCCKEIDFLLENSDKIEAMRNSSKKQHSQFLWKPILERYTAACGISKRKNN